MSTFESQMDPAAGQPKTSGLAIASLVCSLVCCIPLTTIPGILLGIGAMISIGNDPAKRGKGIAITGIVLGVLFTIGQGVIYPGVFGYVKETFTLVMSGPNDVLASGFSGDLAQFKDGFHGDGAVASEAEVAVFIEAVRGRYGEFLSCHFDEANQPAFGPPIVSIPYIYEFSSGEMLGEAAIVFSDPVQGGFINKIGSITIFDPDLGDLTYPSPTAAGAAPTVEAPDEADDEAPAEAEAEEAMPDPPSMPDPGDDAP